MEAWICDFSRKILPTLGCAKSMTKFRTTPPRLTAIWMGRPLSLFYSVVYFNKEIQASKCCPFKEAEDSELIAQAFGEFVFATAPCALGPGRLGTHVFC